MRGPEASQVGEWLSLSFQAAKSSRNFAAAAAGRDKSLSIYLSAELYRVVLPHWALKSLISGLILVNRVELTGLS